MSSAISFVRIHHSVPRQKNSKHWLQFGEVADKIIATVNFLTHGVIAVEMKAILSWNVLSFYRVHTTQMLSMRITWFVL